MISQSLQVCPLGETDALVGANLRDQCERVGHELPGFSPLFNQGFVNGA